jgi:hypothetical protein
MIGTNVQLPRRIRRFLSRNRFLRAPLDMLDLEFERAAHRLWVRRARARRPEGLPVGSRAPRFRFPTPEGGLLTLDSLLERKRPVILLFVADPASAVWDEPLDEVMTHATQAELVVVVVSREGTNGSAPLAAKVLLQHHWEMLKAYRVYSIPSAVLVNPNGTIGSTVAAGAAEIRELVSAAQT